MSGINNALTGFADMSSSEEVEVDQFDELSHHPWLQFPQGMIARNRRDRLLRKSMGQQKAIDDDLLTQFGERHRMGAIIGEDTPWYRLFDYTD
ncbi:hypothetical protein R6Q57_005735 [Mikania cordata]